jgi:hypothetical protein
MRHAARSRQTSRRGNDVPKEPRVVVSIVRLVCSTRPDRTEQGKCLLRDAHGPIVALGLRRLAISFHVDGDDVNFIDFLGWRPGETGAPVLPSSASAARYLGLVPRRPAFEFAVCWRSRRRRAWHPRRSSLLAPGSNGFESRAAAQFAEITRLPKQPLGLLDIRYDAAASRVKRTEPRAGLSVVCGAAAAQ